MRREDIFMEILGDLDERFVMPAMPHSGGYPAAADGILPETTEALPGISKGEVRRYMIMRTLGIAAAVVLVIGGAFLLWQNWDKIAVKDPASPAVITTVTAETTVQPLTEPTQTSITTSAISETVDGYADASDWGIKAYYIYAGTDPYGIRYNIVRSGSFFDGDIRYTDGYIIERYSDGNWEQVILQTDDLYENTLPADTSNAHYRAFGEKLEPGKYRLITIFTAFGEDRGAVPKRARSYMEFEITEVHKTFEVQYYLKNDLAGMAAGYAYPFSGYSFYADGAGWEWVGNGECEGFFAHEHDTFPDEVPDELISILRNYADGDDLRYDLSEYYVPTVTEYYRILDDTVYQFDEGSVAYRFNCGEAPDYLIVISSGEHHDVTVYRENAKYTAARQVIELLWYRYDGLFNVFAVLDSNDGKLEEYLLIVAEDDLSMLGETIDKIAELKELLAQHGLPYDSDLVRFMTPDQVIGEWTPAEIIWEDPAAGEVSPIYRPAVIRADDDVYIRTEQYNTFNDYKEYLINNGIIDADISDETAYKLGEPVTVTGIFSLLTINCDFDLTHHTKLTDDIVKASAMTVEDNTIYVRNELLSEAARKVRYLRSISDILKMNGAPITGIKLYVRTAPGEPENITGYRIVILADKESREKLRSDEKLRTIIDPDDFEFEEN